jgi:hypothetical protein
VLRDVPSGGAADSILLFLIAQSMRLKGEYIAAQNLCGAMFWELSNDDGPLLDALRAGLGSAGTPTE